MYLFCCLQYVTQLAALQRSTNSPTGPASPYGTIRGTSTAQFYPDASIVSTQRLLSQESSSSDKSGGGKLSLEQQQNGNGNGNGTLSRLPTSKTDAPQRQQQSLQRSTGSLASSGGGTLPRISVASSLEQPSGPSLDDEIDRMIEDLTDKLNVGDLESLLASGVGDAGGVEVPTALSQGTMARFSTLAPSTLSARLTSYSTLSGTGTIQNQYSTLSATMKRKARSCMTSAANGPDAISPVATAALQSAPSSADMQMQLPELVEELKCVVKCVLILSLLQNQVVPFDSDSVK